MPLDDPSAGVHTPGVRIGQALKGVREAAGVTQVRLGTLLGFKQAPISKWENGEQLPSLMASLPDLDRALGVSVGTILRAAGFVDDGNTESALMSDERLHPRDRQALVRTYRALSGSDA